MDFVSLRKCVSDSFAYGLDRLEVCLDASVDKHVLSKIRKDQDTCSVCRCCLDCISVCYRITYGDKYHICMQHALCDHLRRFLSGLFARLHYAHYNFSPALHCCSREYFSNILLHHIRNYQDIFSCPEGDAVIHDGPCSLHHEGLFHLQSTTLLNHL